MLRDSDPAVDIVSAAAVGAPPPSRYRHLLTDVTTTVYPRTARNLSAVVVPTSRGLDRRRSGVAFAASLARKHGCPLVLLCSRDALGATVRETLAALAAAKGGGPQVLAVDVDEVLHRSRYLCSATTFAVDALDVSSIAGPRQPDEQWLRRSNDVGRKRNLALLLARAMGWRTLLFVDDDISAATRPGRPTLDGASLGRALDALDHHGAVGWTAVDYPDNSVVGRIRGLGREEPEQFIGGGALLVSVGEATPFFPAIYNEDWLFFLRVLERAPHRTLGYAGDVRQDPYDGFDPRRALDEELGDVLGEGLLVTASGDVHDTRLRAPSFWQEVMDEREAGIWGLRRAFDGRTDLLAGQVAEALGGVLALHEDLARARKDEKLDVATQLASYLDLWLGDCRSWSERMARAQECRPEELLAGCSVQGPMDLRAFVARHRH